MSSKPTLTLSDKSVIDVLKKGVDAVTIPVAKTLGPEAKTTLMYRTYNRGPRNVDDGFYTSEVIIPKNPFVRLVAEFFKEGTMRTNRKVGDGTSATTVIGGALFNDIYSKLQTKAQGYSSGTKQTEKGVMEMKREILSEAETVKEQIKEVSKPIKTLEDLEKISAVSLGQESETSKTIAKMAMGVGADGFIDVVEGYKNEIETELVEGMRFSAKVCGKAFVNKPERHEMVIEDAPVFITNQKLDNDMLVRFIISKCENTKVILMAPSFSDQVLVNMVRARENGTFVWPVKVPSVRTEVLEDVAIFCGAKLYDKTKGHKLTTFKKEDLGHIEKLIVKDVETREDAVLLGGAGEKAQTFTEQEKVEVKNGKDKEGNDKTRKEIKNKIFESNAVQERIKVLKGQLEETKEQQFKMLLERRIASMASAGGVIRVGSPTDAESLPLKLKIEDCVFNCRAALKSGYVKGGGLCLKEIAEKLDDNHILKASLTSPYEQIQKNAGGVLEIGEDIIDSSDSVYYAVEYATSVVASLITIGNLIVEEPEIQQGEGEMKLAQTVNNAIMAWKKKEGILTENEMLQAQDANGGLSQDELLTLDNG